MNGDIFMSTKDKKNNNIRKNKAQYNIRLETAIL